MSKWKCEICNSEFDNFQAQGFNHKIYCPLCYFKELNIRKDKEIQRLNNIIDEIESIVYADIPNIDARISIQEVLDKSKELKGSEKNE